MKKKKYELPLIIKNKVEIHVSEKEEEIDIGLNDDISCLSESESLFTKNTSSSTSVNLQRYFGLNARNEFGRRIKWLSNQRKLLYPERNELLEKTRFESSYDGHSYTQSPSKSQIKTNFQSQGDSTISNKSTNQKNSDEIPSSSSSIIINNNDDVDDNISVDSFDVQTVKEDIQEGTITSPRTKYIAACLKQNMNPRMSLILRKRVSSELNLQHQGMGDSLGLLFAESLRELPYVQSINISDNNLTDISIGPILRSIILMANITSLNISNNMIDSKSTRALADYLKSTNYSFWGIILRKTINNREIIN